MPGPTCLHCTAPTAGMTLCARCQHTGHRALANIPAYHADLFSLPDVAAGMRKAAKVADPTGNAVGQTVSDPVGDAAADAKDTLKRWTRRLVKDRPGQARAFYPEHDTVETLARVLGQHLPKIATTDWADEMLRELTKLEVRLRKIVEANKGRWYAGVCGAVLDEDTGAFCTRILYADPEASEVRCPSCRMMWPVAERRRVLLELARDTETNIATIARALLVLLVRIDGNTSQAKLERRIQNWADRGKLERRGSVDLDGNVRKTYRLGDVLDLLLEERAKTRDTPATEPVLVPKRV